MKLEFLLIVFHLRFSVSLHVPELSGWKENVYVDCIFCVDYDSYRRLNFSGCQKGKTTTCKGNACYMRQHKSSQFFLFTSGCLNLTKPEYDEIARGQLAVERMVGGTGKESLLCEASAPNPEKLFQQVAEKTNTCICRGEGCNNMSIPVLFSEFHTSTLFGSLRFHELLQFRFYMPHTPIFHSVDLRMLDRQLLQSVRGFRFSLSSSPSNFLVISLLFSLFCYF